MSVPHALLALLKQAPNHGYQLHGLLTEELGNYWTVNTGQIYSTLSRLERDGFIGEREDAARADDDRTVYELTGTGKEELNRWLREPVSRDVRLRDGFYAKFVLSRLSPEVSLEEVLQAQRRQLLRELHELTQLRRRAESENQLPQLLLLESAIMHLEADLRWLDLCEARLEDLGDLPPSQYEGRPRGRPPKR
jgi:DNA-binding PadR family transcriptional regulator